MAYKVTALVEWIKKKVCDGWRRPVLAHECHVAAKKHKNPFSNREQSWDRPAGLKIYPDRRVVPHSDIWRAESKPAN